MALFRAKFFDYVSKSDSVKRFENTALSFVGELNEQQKALTLLYKKMKFLNDMHVQSINNYTNQINLIKSAHHAVCGYLPFLFNRHLVTSSQYVDVFEETFECMSEIEQFRNSLTELFVLLL